MEFMCALNLWCVFILMCANKLCKFNTWQVAGSGAHFLFVDGGVGECALTRRLGSMLSLFCAACAKTVFGNSTQKGRMHVKTKSIPQRPPGVG
jgi:hypothetical protein